MTSPIFITERKITASEKRKIRTESFVFAESLSCEAFCGFCSVMSVKFPFYRDEKPAHVGVTWFWVIT